ncbi:hypothetical protein [Thalassobacillus sp. CUG 92003]|uniref:hypothetical protein n=1 Tax=Thalassobacillus sp. CUG 92003 TaxID=2736641 RepID=UPI0015E63A2B|nr:hypothetical protein [Thalassobacillus sp. CUG 92003]
MDKRLFSISLFLVIAALLASCSSEKDDFAKMYPDLMPPEDDVYSVYTVGDSISIEAAQEHNMDDVTLKNRSSLEGSNDQYPQLSLEKSPAYVIFDENGLVLKTYDFKEVATFFEDK